MWTVAVVVAFGVALCGAVLFGVAYYAQRQPQQVDPNGTTVSVTAADGTARGLVVPSAGFVQSMREHVESRRVELSKLLKPSGEARKRWSAKSEEERRAAMREQRNEVCLAVGGFIGGDASLLVEVCPELSDDGLERLAQSNDVTLRLFGQLAEREARLPPPRGGSLAAVEELVATHLKSLGCGKQERSARASFLPLFRRSCLIALALALLEATTKGETRAVERRKFGLQLLQGVGMWALTAGMMRFLPQLLQSIDWGALLLGA